MLTLQQTLLKYSNGPQTGIFTDGSARPNPGPGGWGVVEVLDGEIVKSKYGHALDTTNNQMEYVAVIEALKMIEQDQEITIHIDSQLVVKTLNNWANTWKSNNWKKKSGKIANLELVKEAFYLFKSKKNVTISWIGAHSGYLWNEYADALSTAWVRDEL